MRCCTPRTLLGPTRMKVEWSATAPSPAPAKKAQLTGLPQVTVPAGFFGGRFPMGVSLLGRPWDDRRLLELAAAYERATKHRRPPSTVNK